MQLITTITLVGGMDDSFAQKGGLMWTGEREGEREGEGEGEEEEGEGE